MTREIVLDTETTGLDPLSGHKIIEIGCIELKNKVKTGNFFHVYINPDRDVPMEAYRVHGISTEFLLDKPRFSDVFEKFLGFLEDSPLIIHNAPFDLKFLNYELKQLGVSNLSSKVIDTLVMARTKLPGAPASLDALCRRYNVDNSKRQKHGALLDCELLAEIYMHLTGGAQAVIEFGEHITASNEKMGENKGEKKFREARSFLANQQELEAHQELMQKLDIKVWES
jgi:DNA polymerase III subunit epsilon